jgi:prolyl-tRNA synthetase
LIGALIMTHSDDKGLRLPPKIAPIHVVIVPIYKGLEQLEVIRERITPMMDELRKQGITVKFDDDDTKRSGWKFAEYELKGVPIRLAIGPKDLENNAVEVFRRDTGEKASVSMDKIVEHIGFLMTDIQDNLYKQALQFRDDNITRVDDYETFKELLDSKGGFFLAHWDGTAATEEKVKAETKATIRCIPLHFGKETGKCMVTGAPSSQMVLYARAY